MFRPQQTPLPLPIGDREKCGHVGVVEVCIGGHRCFMASGDTVRIVVRIKGVTMLIVLDG